jgi:hypothetical protein
MKNLFTFILGNPFSYCINNFNAFYELKHLQRLIDAVPPEPVNFESEYPFKKAQK